MRFIAIAAMILVATATATMPGETDLNDNWAYQWYLDEPFYMYCNSSELYVHTGDRVEWETPSGMTLKGTYDGKDYKLSEMLGVESVQLEIKKVREDLHGVYMCRVYNATTLRAKQLVGLNIHDHKYHKLSDKYHQNVIVAIIATVVFIVPVLTSCAVYEFRYQTPEQKEKNRQRRYNQYVAQAHEMKTPIDNGESVGIVEEKGAYENPNFNEAASTNL